MAKTRRRVQRPPLVPNRVRSIGDRGFSFIPNRFLLDGFFAALEHEELLLYILLVLAGDRNGMSFYHYDRISTLLRVPVEQYLRARNSLIQKDLVAFDGTSFQVLELPAEPVSSSRLLRTTADLEEEDAATIRGLIKQSLAGTRPVLDDSDSDDE